MDSVEIVATSEEFGDFAFTTLTNDELLSGLGTRKCVQAGGWLNDG